MTYFVRVYPGRLNNEYSLVSVFLLIEEHPEMTWARPTQDSKKDGMSGWVLDYLRSPSVDSTPLNHRERLTRSIIGPGVRILELIGSCDARRGVGESFRNSRRASLLLTFVAFLMFLDSMWNAPLCVALCCCCRRRQRMSS